MAYGLAFPPFMRELFVRFARHVVLKIEVNSWGPGGYSGGALMLVYSGDHWDGTS